MKFVCYSLSKTTCFAGNSMPKNTLNMSLVIENPITYKFFEDFTNQRKETNKGGSFQL